MNTEISKDKTECVPESAMLEKIKMFKTYRIEEIWTNQGDRSNQQGPRRTNLQGCQLRYCRRLVQGDARVHREAEIELKNYLHFNL